jgi:tetratricopeptide (TPR) repeat protein
MNLSRRFFSRRCFPWAAAPALALVLTLMVGGSGMVRAQDQMPKLWEAPISSTAGQPLLAELFADGQLHVVVSDREGRVRAFHGRTGERLWQTKLGASLSDPVCGFFAPDGTLGLAVASLDDEKRLFILRASTGETLFSTELDAPAAEAPSPFPLANAEPSGPDAPLGALHGVAVADVSGIPHLFRVAADAKSLEKLWDAPVTLIRELGNRKPRTPPAVGEVLGAGRLDIVVAYVDGMLAINRDDPNIYEFFSKSRLLDGVSPDPNKKRFAAEQAEIWTLPVVANVQQNARVDGANFDEIIFGFAVRGSAYYGALEYHELRAGDYHDRGFINVWADRSERQSLMAPPRDPLIVELAGAGHPEIVLCGRNEVSGFDGLGLARIFHATSTQSYQASPIAIYGENQESTVLLFANHPQGSEIRARYVPNITGQPSNYTLDFTLELQPVAGDLDGDAAHHEIVFTTTDKRLVCYRLAKLRTVPAGEISWQCRGGNPFRSGRMTPEWLALLANRRAALKQILEKNLADAREAQAKGDAKAAREALNVALAINPRIPEAAEMNSGLRLRENLLWLILGFLALVGLLGAGGWLGWREGTKRLGLNKARKLSAAGKPLEALEVCHQLRAKFPGDSQIRTLLVKSAIAGADWSERNIPPFREEWAANNADRDVLEGLVNCLLNARDPSPENFAVYKRAEELMPEDAELKFAMGALFKRQGDSRLAREYLRKAVKLPDPPDDAFLELADLLLAENAANAKAVDIFAEARAIAPDDAKILRGYCLTLIDAKRFDEEALEVHEEMLDVDPNFIPSLAQLCEARIQEGELENAQELVLRIRELEPENSQGIFLLAQCCLLLAREDDAAVEALKIAAERFPDDKEIVSTLAKLFVKRGAPGDETGDTYKRAFELNPNDAEIAATVARAAAERKDSALLVTASERLIELGAATPDDYRRLAQEYLTRGVSDEKAAPVFREALKADPKNRELILRFARVCKSLDRVDPEALKAYRAAYELSPTLEIGRQLVKAFDANDMLQEVVELAPRLLEQLPDDPDLQKRFAKASLASDRADVAIEQYRRVLERAPNDADALVHLAAACARKGRLDDESVAAYKRALEIEPKQDLVWMMMGRSALTREREAEALDAYKKAATAGEDSPDRVIRELKMIFGRGVESLPLRWLLAELLVHRNRLSEACEELGAIFERDPSQMERVIGAYGTILKKDPENALALLRRGVLLKAMGDFEAAERDLRAAFDANPSHVDAQRELAHLYEAMLRERDDAQTRHRLGQVYAAMEEFDRAIGCFQRSSQDYRFQREAIRSLGLCFVRKGMLDLALQEFKKLPVDADMKDILYDLAQRYEKKKDLVGAKTVFKSLFAADIDFRDVRQRFESLAGSTSDPMILEQTKIHQDLSLDAQKRYELLEELGRGAMGIVYKARDNELDEIVALKILPEQISNNPEAVKRFRLEARAARRLAHPHIIRIHDIGEELGRKFISMEFVEGTDLKHKFRTEGPPDFPTLVRWTREVASALDYAHNQGIVHRDIKPANIMIARDGGCKVADFGIAKALDAADNTMTGAVMGTPLYMSPEQVRGGQIDHRADIYSFGIMLYEFASGRPPFTEGDLAYQHMNVAPPPIGREIDERFKQMVMKCLAKERENRWDSCGAMIKFLNTFVD